MINTIWRGLDQFEKFGSWRGYSFFHATVMKCQELFVTVARNLGNKMFIKPINAKILHQDVHQDQYLPIIPSGLERGGGALQLLVAVHLLHLSSDQCGLERLQAAALAQGQQRHPSSLLIATILTATIFDI